MVVQCAHCISDNICIKEALNKNFLEVFRIGLGGAEDLGFFVAKFINITNFLSYFK